MVNFFIGYFTAASSCIILKCELLFTDTWTKINPRQYKFIQYYSMSLEGVSGVLVRQSSTLVVVRAASYFSAHIVKRLCERLVSKFLYVGFSDLIYTAFTTQ